MVEHLSVFEEATKPLSGDKYEILSMVMPTFIELFSYIENVVSKPDVIFKIKQALTKAHSILSKNYGFSDDSVFYLAAIILDPRFKAQYLIGKDFNNLYDNIVDKVVEKLTQLLDATTHVVQENEKESAPVSSSRLFKNMFKHSAGTTNMSELEQYLNLLVESHSVDLLQWWKSYMPQFSKVSMVARDILAIPESAVSVERVFNIGQDVIGILRHALSQETISNLMFGNHYLK